MIDVFYLIEFPRGSRDPAMGSDGWWSGRVNGQDVFTWNVTDAIQFRSRRDAEEVRNAAHISGYTVVTEHSWVAGVPPERDP